MAVYDRYHGGHDTYIRCRYSGKYARLSVSSGCKSLELKEREVQYSLCRTVMSAFASPVSMIASACIPSSCAVCVGLYGPTSSEGLLCSARPERCACKCGQVNVLHFISGGQTSSIVARCLQVWYTTAGQLGPLFPSGMHRNRTAKAGTEPMHASGDAEAVGYATRSRCKSNDFLQAYKLIIDVYGEFSNQITILKSVGISEDIGVAVMEVMRALVTILK
jgi:hypothetical protein